MKVGAQNLGRSRSRFHAQQSENLPRRKKTANAKVAEKLIPKHPRKGGAAEFARVRGSSEPHAGEAKCAQVLKKLLGVEFAEKYGVVRKPRSC